MPGPSHTRQISESYGQRMSAVICRLGGYLTCSSKVRSSKCKFPESTSSIVFTRVTRYTALFRDTARMRVSICKGVEEMTRRVLLSASHAPDGCRLEPRLLPFVTLAGRDQIGCSIVASASETASFQPWLEQNTS